MGDIFPKGDRRRNDVRVNHRFHVLKIFYGPSTSVYYVVFMGQPDSIIQRSKNESDDEHTEQEDPPFIACSAY